MGVHGSGSARCPTARSFSRTPTRSEHVSQIHTVNECEIHAKHAQNSRGSCETPSAKLAK
eukprot:229262-Prymnesium_polylepis.1